MSINGLTNSPSSFLTTRPEPTGSRGLTNDAPTQAPQSARGTIAPASTNAKAAQQAQAPAGTDPELWSILTTEERNFFSKTVSSGPLTYSRMMLAKNGASAAPAPAARGVRVDVRV